MTLEAYLFSLAEDYFGDDNNDVESLTEFIETNVYSNELCYLLYSGRFDIQPKLVIFDGQCHPEDGSRTFYNRGEDTLYYLVNWEQYQMSKTIAFNQYFDRCRLSLLVVWKNTTEAHKASGLVSGLDGNATATCIYTGSSVPSGMYEFFEVSDFVTFDELLQVLKLQGLKVDVEGIKRDAENYLAYYRNDCFFEQLKWFYNPTIGNRILAVDGRTAGSLNILKGLFLG